MATLRTHFFSPYLSTIPLLMQWENTVLYTQSKEGQETHLGDQLSKFVF